MSSKKKKNPKKSKKPKTSSDKPQEQIRLRFSPLFFLAAGSLLVLIGLRVYAALYTVPIVTWDDRYYRAASYQEARAKNLFQSIEAIVLPNSANLHNARTVGYHSWLVFGLHFFDYSNFDKRWQMTNFLMFLLQALLVFYLAWWSIRDRDFALAMTFLYLSCPIVFGMNRWIMTENHVMLSLLAYYAVPLFLVSQKGKQPFRQILWGAGAAFLLGIFSTAREYVIPSMLAVYLCVVMVLVIKRQFYALVAFIVVLAPYVVAAVTALPPVLNDALKKSRMSEYDFPIHEWVAHVFIYSAGPALFLFLCYSLYQVAPMFYQRRKEFSWKKLFQPNSVVLVCFCSLFIAYCLGIVIVDNRVIRPSIPPLVTFVALAMVGFSFCLRFDTGLKAILQRASFVFIPLSWVVLIYQLFIAFEGGETYAHMGRQMEKYNHPMHLRELKGPKDIHAIPAPPLPEKK